MRWPIKCSRFGKRYKTFQELCAVTIAQDVDANSVAEITTRSTELIGMSAEQSYTRVNPKNTTAAHIVGYMGKVYSEEELAELEEKGIAPMQR